MEKAQSPATATIKGELFDIIKPTRLRDGKVLRSKEREVYARIGVKQAALEEQIHTVSLYERGFPVARVLDSGDHSDSEWYFVEESLGHAPFHEQFANEYSSAGEVSDETFERYAAVVGRYIDAQFAPANRTSIAAEEFVELTIPDEHIVGNYAACKKDVDRYKTAVELATRRLEGSPMGVLQLDLNPYNILDRGVIDFELVGYGPLGYDTLLVSLWHRWFTSDQSSRYSVAYYLTESQVATIAQEVSDASNHADVPDPAQYMQEFLLIKSAWGFSSSKSMYDEESSKRTFYEYRARLLEHCVDRYLASEPIDPFAFPEIRA